MLQSRERGTDVSWERFWANYKNTKTEFEHLCTDLFRMEYFTPDTRFTLVHNNPGVECHPQRAKKGDLEGKLVGFQAKHFGGSVDYNRNKESVRKTLKNYHENHSPGTAIEVFILYCNQPISQKDINGGPSGDKDFTDAIELLQAAGVKPMVIAGNDLLNCIRNYQDLVERYFYV